MSSHDINREHKKQFNTIATHPLQSYEWGEFREKTGVKVIRRGFFENNPSASHSTLRTESSGLRQAQTLSVSKGSDSKSSGEGKLIDAFQCTIHKIPHLPWNAGYLPKGNVPTKETLSELKNIGEKENCIFIQLEPDVLINDKSSIIHHTSLRPAAHPLFTKYTFILDLTKSEDELLKNMHPKTRYNIKVAQKHGVTVQENNSDTAFETYVRLTKETTTRQGFFAHSEKYHRLMWNTLKLQGAKEGHSGRVRTTENNKLSAHLLTATFQKQILVTWILFTFHDTLYYPYGASSSEHRETMASNLMMWEAIRFGKTLGLTKFDMWGSLGPDPNPKDPWFGFHRFKQGYGGELVEFVGSYDLIIKPVLYFGYTIADKARWAFLQTQG